MLAHFRIGARTLSGALALTLLPILAFAQNPAPTVNPWKLGYAKRLADERLAEKRERRERDEHLRKLARQLKRGGKSAQRGRGEHARPAQPDDLKATPAVPNAAPRTTRPFAARAFTTPANHMANNRGGDVGDAGQSETSIAAFGNNLVAAWNDGQGFQFLGADTQGWATSTDGGVTWADRDTFPSTVPGVTGFKWTSDPVLTVNEKTGAFYFAALCDFNDLTGSHSGVALTKGRFNGATFTWGTPVIARSVLDAVDFVDKEWIVADSVSNRVFLSYSRFPSGLSRIEFQYADSSLSGFSSPQLISIDNPVENGFVQASRPIVDGDGRLFVMYYLIGQGESDFYRLCRSDNSGVSFTAPVTAVSLFTNFGTGSPGFNRPIGVDFAGISVDRSTGPHRGRLYLSWAESIDWLDDVFNIGLSGNKSEVEPNSQAVNATPAVVGQTVRGTISTTSDVDLFAISLAAGQHLLAAADSTQSVDELSLRLLAGNGITGLTFTTFDASVNPSTQNPQGIPSGWLFTAPTSGTYYLRVASRLGVATGSYRIRLGLADRVGERGRDQRDAFVAWSDDGNNWSIPTRVNGEPAGYDDFLPEVNVAPDGSVYCAWFDYHDAPAATDGGQAAVYLARSGDGGFSWTTLGAVTDTLSDWSGTVSNIEPNQGDYLSLFSTSSYLWPCWSDARRGDPDVFTAQIPLIPVTPSTSFPLSMSPPRPDPVTGESFVASFSLATNDPADLILFDISGREIQRQTVSPGSGPHTFALSVPPGTPQGFYILTLRQGGHNASTRVHLVR